VRIDLSGQAGQTNLNVAFWAKSYSSYWGVSYLRACFENAGFHVNDIVQGVQLV